jgi:hypothetical protein
MDRVAHRIKFYEEATEYAKATTPPPQWSPWYAATTVAFGLAILGAITGVGPQAQTLTAILAGAITFFALWRQNRKHEAAVSARYKELLSAAGDDGAPIRPN